MRKFWRNEKLQRDTPGTRKSSIKHKGHAPSQRPPKETPKNLIKILSRKRLIHQSYTVDKKYKLINLSIYYI